MLARLNHLIARQNPDRSSKSTTVVVASFVYYPAFLHYPFGLCHPWHLVVITIIPTLGPTFQGHLYVLPQEAIFWVKGRLYSRD